jgi:hypothetical protein
MNASRSPSPAVAASHSNMDEGGMSTMNGPNEKKLRIAPPPSRNGADVVTVSPCSHASTREASITKPSLGHNKVMTTDDSQSTYVRSKSPLPEVGEMDKKPMAVESCDRFASRNKKQPADYIARDRIRKRDWGKVVYDDSFHDRRGKSSTTRFFAGIPHLIAS